MLYDGSLLDLGILCFYRVVFLYMFGGLLDEGSARSSGSPSSPVIANEISLENSAICFLMISCRLELSL